MQEIMRSFLKYAGSKAKSVNFLKTHLLKGKRLVEPFVGSAVIFLNTDYDEYLLGDSNPDLINVFNWVKSEKKQFIVDLEYYFCPQNNSPEMYNAFRQDFNMYSQNEYTRALLFVYLNRHGFNGLCRYNSKGQYNVPFGQNPKPYFPLTELKAFIDKSDRASFVCADFIETLSWVQEGDVIYCDPPFISLDHKESQLLKLPSASLYMRNFNVDEHYNLIEYGLQSKVPFFISNHDTPDIRQIYESYNPIKLESYSVRRLVAADVECRNMVKELLVQLR